MGLVLPRLLGLIPVLTPIAAGCLALLMGAAVVTHVRRHESPAVPAILSVVTLGVAVASGFHMHE
jgi:DoxX-like family